MSSTLDGAKVGDSAYRDAQYNETVKWGAIGFFGGGALVGYPILALASRKWPYVAKAHPSVRFSFCLSSGCAIGTIAADKAGLRFDRLHRNDVGAAMIAQSQTKEEQIWSSLSPAQKALTYTKDNKVSVVIGGWFASITAVALYLQTTPMTGPQKLVQARVWAQGATVAAILGMAALSQVPTPGDEIEKLREANQQHSWMQSLEYEQPSLKHALQQVKEQQGQEQK